jgi:hypothetical protein
MLDWIRTMFRYRHHPDGKPGLLQTLSVSKQSKKHAHDKAVKRPTNRPDRGEAYGSA